MIVERLQQIENKKFNQNELNQILCECIAMLEGKIERLESVKEND